MPRYSITCDKCHCKGTIHGYDDYDVNVFEETSDPEWNDPEPSDGEIPDPPCEHGDYTVGEMDEPDDD